ncbi:N-formyl-4-amino-5-aminomethyl-2-methylpyrimidine deformylase [compost metagenome]
MSPLHGPQGPTNRLPDAPAPRFDDAHSPQRDALIAFAQELIGTPSPSGAESAVATLIATRLRELGFDDVFTDEVGNVVALLKGRSDGPSVLFCSHMDTPEPGDVELWERDPLDAHLDGDTLSGLGASDAKGSIASYAFGLASLKASGLPLAGDVVLACVVMAERAEGFGISHLFEKTLPARGIRPALVVMGDPTGLNLYLGQRGRLELEVTTVGRTAHASTPWLGQNAVYKMVPVVEGLQELSTLLPSHPFLGKSTISLTQLSSTPGRYSIIPDRCIAAIDRRFLPNESLETILSQVQAILIRTGQADAEFRGEAKIRIVAETAYTGVTREVPKLLAPFVTPESNPWVEKAVAALEGLGESPRFDKWHFSTEGGYTAGVLGIPTLGYAPGEENYSHTPYDRVSVDKLVRAAHGSAAIALAVAGAPAD